MDEDIQTGYCSVCRDLKRITQSGLIYRHGKCDGGGHPPGQSIFDEIVESQPEDNRFRIESLWDAIKAFWPPLHSEEGVLVKGMIIVECVDHDGDTNLFYVSSPYTSPWDIKGMATHVLQVEAAEETAAVALRAIANAQRAAEQAEDDDEDEQ